MVWDHENSISFSYFLNKKHVSETFLYTVVMNNSLNSFKLTISNCFNKGMWKNFRTKINS